MFNKKLLLLQNSFGVVPKSAPVSSSTPTPVLTPYITSFQKLLLMRNALGSNIQQGRLSTFSSTGIVSGFANFQTDLTFDSFGVMALNGAASPTVTFNNSPFGSVIRSGTSSLDLDLTFDPTATIILNGILAQTVDLSLSSAGGILGENFANLTLDIVLSALGNITRGGAINLTNQFALGAVGTRNLNGTASLFNEITLASRLNGTFGSAVDMDVVFALVSAGVLTSENIDYIVRFNLIHLAAYEERLIL